MSTTAEKLSYLNETKTQLKDMLNLGGASLTTEPFRQYVDTLKNRYLYFMNNGTQQVWDNWIKVNGTGETLTLNNTEEAPMSLVYKGNTLQEGTPTPETPQDIHVVSGDNSIDVCGKNICQSSSKLSSAIIGFNPTKAIQKTFTLSFITNETVFANSIYFVIDGTNYTVGTISGTGKITQTYTISDTIYNAIQNATTFDLRIYKSGASFNVPEEAMILNGTYTAQTIPKYEAYKGASYPITLPEGMFLGWIPNTTYQDEIFKNTPNTTDYDSNLEDNVWYLKKEIGKVNNLSSYYRDLTTNYNNLQYIRINKMTDSANYGNSNNIPVVFTHGIYQVITVFDQAVNIGRITSSGGYSYFYFGVDKTITTIEQAQTLLSNATIYYPLATPTYTEITDSTLLSQLEAVKRSYDGQTNISQNSNNLPFILNVSALEKNSSN